jgi:hypothetical protein
MPRLDPTLALTKDQLRLLALADPRDAEGVLRVSASLSLDQLAGAPMLTNARTLLSALAESPVRATKSLGNFERRFAARMRDELRFDPDHAWVLEHSRSDNEQDVPGLHDLRVVLGLAGLLKKRNGRFSVTQRGRRLLEPQRAAELYELLLRTYFGKFNIFYPGGYAEDPVMQRHIVLGLWIIRRLAEQPVDAGHIAEVIPRDEARWDPRFDYSTGRLGHAVAFVVLEPLRAFSLLSGGERGETLSGERAPWQVTALFDEALSFDFGTTAAAPPVPTGAAVASSPDAPGAAPGASPDDTPATVARLLVTLVGVKPPISRRIEVPLDATFERLHAYLVAAMGWLDYHLHEFEVGRRRISASDADWESEWPYEDEARVTLRDALGEGLRELVYRYDFGDDWEHRVQVEAVEPGRPGVFYPRCLEARRACPPEDSGGVAGYLELLDALGDPDDPEHAELLEWLDGPFDPEAVDLEGIDRLLHLAATGEIRPEDLDYFSGA